ncbi:hypothetical protein EV586_102700 [Tumebacillus sp. BK434]|uniref:hypothetical protein n=1 Tax=Tumebacillus sp. BK434 TaxID=2512169 RepID=UPI0010454257|nr:hypothetical protein [Tumebacillus sp. BK434]TCP58247.1 hypothetical protein EV586_102700 [Tumebacillus sp. BK434]
MQDRAGLPESLERAFEHVKSEPGDFELASKRAAAWATVQQKGRRGQWLDRWKLFIAGLAGVAVAALAVLIPVQVSHWQTEGQPGAVPPRYSQDAYQQKVDHYRSLGFEVVHVNLESGLDLVYDDRTVYAFEDGRRTKLFEIDRDDRVAYLDAHGAYIALYSTSAKSAKGEDRDDLYLLNTQTLATQKIDTTGEVMWAQAWNVLPAKLLYAQRDPHSKKQQIVAAEWKTGQVEVLLETGERYYNRARNYYQSVVIDNGYGIELLVEGDTGREWREIARSQDGSLQTYDIDGDFVHYFDKSAFYRYSIRERQTIPILQTGGEPQIIRYGSSDYAYLISVYKENEPYEPLTSSKMRYGTLELWRAGRDGEAPHKLWSKADVAHIDRHLFELTTTGIAPHQQADWIELKAGSSDNWRLLVNRKTDEVKEVPVNQQN